MWGLGWVQCGVPCWGAPALALAAAQLAKITLGYPVLAMAQYEVGAPEGTEASFARSTVTTTS